MIKTRGIEYFYDKNQNLIFPDLECNKGEQLLLLGKSGSGKTTLLHVLGGLLSPKKGEVWIDETDITRLSPSELDRFRGQKVGIIFQTAHFVKALTVEENLILAQQLAGLKPDKQLIFNYLDKLGLSQKLKSKPDELSVGEQQRINIIRALINTPSVILADEPTSALDDTNADEVIRLLENQAREANATLIIVTHDSRMKNYFTKQIILNS